MAFDAAVASPEVAERVEFDFQAGASLGVSGTPTVFVDGERLELRSASDIEAAIEEALAAR